MSINYYTVRVLDADGCEMTGNNEVAGRGAAIADAKGYLADREYAADVARLEVRDANDTIVWDWNAPRRPVRAPREAYDIDPSNV